MVIASVVGCRQFTLRIDGAAEFAGHHHQRIVEHPALLEILHQRPAWLVDLLALAGEHLRQEAVDIPAAMVDLNEAHVPFGQPPRHETSLGERSGLARLFAVRLPRAGRLSTGVGQLGHGSLHAEGHFVLCHAGPGLRIAHFCKVSWFISARPSNIRRRTAAGTPSGLLMNRTGSPELRRLTAACWPERNPALHRRAEIACTFALG